MQNNKIILLSYLLCWVIPVSAQDNHYWTQQYGARSSLLGGAVVAGIEDNSASYYNPGRLSFMENPGLSVNANAYNLNWLTINDGAGTDIDLISRSVNFYPQLISGTFDFRINENLKAGYVLLTRQQSQTKFNVRNEMFRDVLSNLPGDEEYIGTYELETSNSELWPGLCIAYQLSDKIGIGITQFVNYHDQAHRHSVFIRSVSSQMDTVSNAFHLATFNLYENFTVDNVSLLWKIGFAFDFDHWKFGFTYTTPSVNIFGLGSVQREISLLNLSAVIPDTANGRSYNDLLAINRQVKLPTTHKSPQSISLGVHYSTGNTNISLAAEYFFRIPVYTVIEPEPASYIRPSNVYTNNKDNPSLLRYQNYSERIINAGFGIENRLADNYTLLLGFRTDYNSYVSDEMDYRQLDGIFSYPTKMNYYHFSAGLSFHRRKNELTLGLNYSLGKEDNLNQFINLTEANEFDYMMGLVNPVARAIQHTFSLVIGYLYKLH